MAAHAQTILEGTSAHALQTMAENAVNWVSLIYNLFLHILTIKQVLLIPYNHCKSLYSSHKGATLILLELTMRRKRFLTLRCPPTIRSLTTSHPTVDFTAETVGSGKAPALGYRLCFQTTLINKISNFPHSYVSWILTLIVNAIILFSKIIKGISVLCHNDCVNKFLIIRTLHYADLFAYIYDVHCSRSTVLIIQKEVSCT